MAVFRCQSLIHAPFLACLLFFAITVQPASTLAAASILEKIDFVDVPLETVLTELENHTRFSIQATDAAARIRVSVSMKKVTAIQVIDQLAKTYHFWYRVNKENQFIHVYTTADRERSQPSSAKMIDNKIIDKLDFKNVSIGEALQILADHSDINIIASESAASIPVTLYLNHVTAMQVIDALAKTYHLWYKIDRKNKIVRLYSAHERNLERHATNNRKLDKVIQQIEFKSITVGNALRILAEQSGLNVMASEDAAKINITMFLRNVTAMEVIDAISKTYNLWYQRDNSSNIVRLYTVREYRLEQVDFKKEDTEIFTMKNAKNALDLAEMILNLYGRQRVRLSFGAKAEALIRDLESRFELFDMIDGRTTIVNSGGRGGNNNNNNNNTNRNQNFNNRNNNRLNRQLGGGNQIPLNEYLQSTEGVIKQFGGETKGSGISNLLLGDQGQTRHIMSAAIRQQAPIYVGVISRQNRVLVRSRDHDALADIRKLYQKLNVDSSMLLLEVKILALELGDGFNSLFDFKIKSGDVTVGTLEQTSLTDAAANAALASAGAFDPTLLATIVSKNFEARLELFEQENRVTELATPILLTANQEVSRIFVGKQQPIVTGYSASNNQTNQVGGIGTVFSSILVPDTQLEDIGTTLLLTPNINADNSVSIRVLVEQSTIADESASIPVPINNELVDAEIDIVEQRTYSGTVTAQNATSVAVGGLIEEGSADREKKVPVLGDIPYLGFFFRETSKVRRRTELVVIMKPFILENPKAAEPASDRVLANNSIHPEALYNQERVMNVYKNDSRHPKGYQLQKPYKLYDRQDAFDDELDKGDVHKATNKVEDVYVQLTNHAAEMVRKPVSEWVSVDGIEPVRINKYRPLKVMQDAHVMTFPIASWSKNGLTVTALEIRNQSKHPIEVDYTHLNGKWLAATIEESHLQANGSGRDTTYLYLISDRPFDEMAKTVY